MATGKWAAPSTRSANIAGSTLNSLADGSESAAVTYDNSTNRDIQAVVTIKLGSLTPGTGGSIFLRVTKSDGTDVEDKINGDVYAMALTSGAGAKVVMREVRLPPFSLRLSVLNRAGASFAASGNEIYVRPWNEESV